MVLNTRKGAYLGGQRSLGQLADGRPVLVAGRPLCVQVFPSILPACCQLHQPVADSAHIMILQRMIMFKDVEVWS